MPMPELIADYDCLCGENPLWRPHDRRLYWVDIPTGRMFRYDPASGAHEQCYEGDVVGGFTVQEDGPLLLFMARGAVRAWDGGFVGTVLDEIPRERESRFNDVIADPRGRVFGGTMARDDRPGSLYRLDPDGGLERVLEGLGCPNGMGFTPDRAGFYFTDSVARCIYLFDYDESTGALANRREFVRLPDDLGMPDGMTVDAEGCVWSAVWDGGCVMRFDPEGREERRISFPARKVSSVTFGGDDCADMYVTTAGGGDKAAEGPGAGALFRLDAGVRGVPEFLSRVEAAL